jgi:capsular exopolysaccharide synthesis family protein
MELAEYWRILRAHWVGVVLIVAATTGLAAAYTETQPAVYAANASGFVSAGTSDNPALGSVNDALAKSRAVSYVDIAQSRSTAQNVIDDLGLDASPSSLVGSISVEQPPDTVLLKITAEAGTPAEAQALADAWVRALAAQVAEIEDPRGRQRDGVLRVLPVEAAALPGSPVSPNPPRNLLIGAGVGLLLGLAYALLRNSVDRRLRTKEDVESKFPVSVVGSIPTAQVLDRKSGEAATIAVDARGRQLDLAPASEAFRKLRTNLMYMNVDDPPRVVIVTSALPGEGKSTVAANLAAAIDSSGEEVVLIDGDLRRPTVATSFGLVEGVGLTDVLAGRIALEDALQQAAGHDNLRILGAGAIPPNPSELLGSKAMQQVLRKLATSALVVVDAPPLLPVTDAAVLAAGADGAFVVVAAGKTLDHQLQGALEHLDAVEAKTLGVVLNRISRRTASQYGGYYGEAEPLPGGKRRAASATK